MSRSIKSISFVALMSFGCVNAATIEQSNRQPAIKTGLQWDAEIGLGYDNNIYRAPGDSYIDYGKICDPTIEVNCAPREDGANHALIEPVKQSGAYIPANVDLEYVNRLSGNNFMLVGYKFDSETYADSKYDNANNYGHKVRLGDEFVIENVGNKTHSVYAGGLFEYKKRLYLDRDTGEEQTSAGNIDISNRYTYKSIGIDAQYKNRINAFQYDVEVKWYQRDYEDPVDVSQYDHTYFRLGGDVSYKLAKLTKLTLGYKYYVYDYDERPSRSSDGRLLTSNPAREYQYDKVDVTLRHRISKSWLAYLDYKRKTRTDKYVGYDNYTKDLVKVRIRYDVNKNHKIKFSYAYWERDYPNAYAFDNKDIGISKQYDGVDLKLSSTTQLDKSKSIAVDIKYVDENSSDLRYDYDRYKVFVSFQWEG